MNEYKRLNDVDPTGVTGNGIFRYLDNKSVPWAESEIGKNLDLEYYGNISGNKVVSPLCSRYVDLVGTEYSDVKVHELTLNQEYTYDLKYTPERNGSVIVKVMDTTGDNAVDFKFICNGFRQIKGAVSSTFGASCSYNGTDRVVITLTRGTGTLLGASYIIGGGVIPDLYEIVYDLNIQRWTKLWATLEFEYNPISNYDMTEVLTDDETVMEYGKTDTRTNNLTHTKTGTETDAPTLTKDTTNKVSGFNSATAQNADETHESSGGTDQITYNTSEADTGTVTDVGSGSDTHTRNYTLERSGNIGVTTSQQMLESEREVWMWKFFYDVVFPDVDRGLTIQTY